LERGYALVYRNGQIDSALSTGSAGNDLVKDAGQLRPHDNLRIRFARGRALARVVETEKEK